MAVAKAARADLSQALTLEAEFRPFQEIDVHAKVAGYLKKIYVDVGDRVKAGQVLAVLEIPELLDDVQQDEAAIRRSTEEINRAHADLDRAQSAHEVAHLAADAAGRASCKQRPNLVAQQDIDEATARDRGAEAQVATAKAALAAAEQQLAVVEGDREQDAHAARVRADHRAVCRRDHAPLRRHRRHDSGRHLVADADDAARAAVARTTGCG